MKVHDIVARCAQAAESPESMRAVRAVLEELRTDLAGLARALEFIPGTGGNARQIFYRAPNLSLLKVCFPGGKRTPPHDHGTWAMILLISGEEKNTLYRREHGRLRQAGEMTLKPGAILPMLADAVHVAESVGSAPAIGLHVYGGDLLELPRRLWNPETLDEHALDWGLYDTFARMASEAASAPTT